MRRIIAGFVFVSLAGASCASSECMILGDSIAVGVSRMMARTNSPQCETIATIGLKTAALLSKVPLSIDATSIIISTGSNDSPTRPREYGHLRNRIHGKVTWLLPAKQFEARGAITQLARIHGDQLVDLATLPLQDEIHPTLRSYSAITNELRSSIRETSNQSSKPYQPIPLYIF